ncbi:tetratricopeptide repeat protein [Roseobacter ponti]|uniref:Tetratricopeptide repeat protein n=1 Tax=Roseobacter ponti TaxID=1891787 RepID=A0A858SRU0_9RHOB|nr:tetratricopeptide repeat protein [Roseobacter ponti]QJF50707.1 tetratricopeptide repeat protein [Roseobacter ponti]
MSIKSINLKSVVAALLAVFVLSVPSQAQDRASELLRELSEAPESEAGRLDRELSLIWDRSGSASMDLLLRRGREALEEDDNRRAIEHLSALTDHAPDFAEGWHARATAYYRAGLYGPALEDLRRALALNPSNYNAIFGLGVMLREFGDEERAAAAFDRVLELNPHHENAQTAIEQLRREGIGRTL